MASKRGRTAPIWNYMELSESDVTVCLTCKDTFKYTGSTTSNLIKHIRTKHPLEYAELREESDSGVAANPTVNVMALSDLSTNTNICQYIVIHQ